MISCAAQWLGNDPAALRDSISGYVFCRCNPIRLTDRTGFQSVSSEAEVKDRSRLMAPEEFVLWASQVHMPQHWRERYVFPVQGDLTRQEIQRFIAQTEREKGTQVIGEYRGQFFQGSQDEYRRFKTRVDVQEWLS